jgi:hypothetical protein
MREPKLRTADKVRPPYALGKFSNAVILKIGEAIVYHLNTRNEPRLEGQDWESIFANSIGAEWKPSNVGLDDIRLGNCCWGAKTVKASKPSSAKKVRLISGRNSLHYSYDESDVKAMDPNDVGILILGIWNDRVSSVRQRFAHTRTVVLIKSNDLSENAIFEFETLREEVDRYKWKWNDKNNLEGFDENGAHKFTWQPHGAQFTIIESVPIDRIAFKVKLPSPLSKEQALELLGFNNEWVTIIQ